MKIRDLDNRELLVHRNDLLIESVTLAAPLRGVIRLYCPNKNYVKTRLPELYGKSVLKPALCYTPLLYIVYLKMDLGFKYLTSRILQ